VDSIRLGTLISRCTLLAFVLVGVAGCGSLSATQRSDDRAIDQAQRAILERIATPDGNVMVRFAADVRTDSPSEASRRVRGSGMVVRSNDGKARSFSYGAVVNTSNSQVQDVHFEWRGDWQRLGTNRQTRMFRLDRERGSWTATDDANGWMPAIG
jgi:hypothetical protein